MRKFFFSLFAIAVAAVAAMTATTALLNTPQRPAAALDTAALAVDAPPSSAETPPATSKGAPAATPGGTPDTGKPATAADGKPGAAADDDEGDKDPYEGVPEEELPPDMQYSADSSVSFPTNL